LRWREEHRNQGGYRRRNQRRNGENQQQRSVNIISIMLAAAKNGSVGGAHRGA
jgi:hypothetical protein